MLLHPILHHRLAEARVREIRRHGGRRVWPEGDVVEAPITIRPARSQDAPALARLAALAGAVLPGQPILVAESAGFLRAACSIGAGAAIEDPHDRGHASALLALRAAQLAG